MSTPRQIAVTGSFDDQRSPTLRFLQEAARLGEVTVLLWPDDTARQLDWKELKYPLAERAYFLRALRCIKQVIPVSGEFPIHALPGVPGFKPDLWALEEARASPAQRAFCDETRLPYRVISTADMRGFPPMPGLPATTSGPRKKVVVTGTFDWLHSGHVRFFEEASSYGDLYVVVGHDANIRLLKGEGHPLFPQEERRYVVQSMRYVTETLISSGDGWLDAAPEIERIKPDIYAVNEDGDKGGKREYCRQKGIQYLVSLRLPAPGLPRRSSTDLRGF